MEREESGNEEVTVIPEIRGECGPGVGGDKVIVKHCRGIRPDEG